ncbi:cerebellin-2-like [Brachyhypopomus gauderio]|uniref:cerebellin-2-like n=1 Tax=Brachyhypopomus gauderio TaxID=698409 RepID=UPI0040414BF1
MLILKIVFMLFMWSAQAQDILTPSIDIIGELQKIKLMEEKMKAMETELEELRRVVRDQPRVAFSASLSTLETGFKNLGPHHEPVILVYENTFTNIGNASNPNTGIFTAPVRGVYYFSFVVFNPYDLSTGLNLMKNKERVVSVSDNPPGADTEDTASNFASLLLEKGDQVYLQLMEYRKVYTDKWRRNTFSGHLIFTM